MTKNINLTTALTSSLDKIYTNEDLWYFDTEDGETVGPFRYRSEAENNLTRFLEQLQTQLGVD
ncbi:MAG: hypothetical protein ACI95C_000532 [Pseudohongiellaceae bacterium]|jgi:hypothetical protein